MDNDFTQRGGRREFIKRASFLIAALPALPLGLSSLSGCSKTSRASAEDKCEWCGATDAPADVSWRDVLASADEPGEPLIISGTVFQPDGRTPARDILLYAYHTDARGYYRTNKNEHRHGRLRGWMRTGADGKYEFRTIKPAPYPGRTEAAHIHMTVSGPGYPEYWIESIVFEDDKLLTAEKRANLSGRGGFNPILTLKRDDKGVWRGTRDIRLERISK